MVPSRKRVSTKGSRHRYGLFAVCAGLVVLGVTLFLTRDTPQSLYREGRAVLDTDPARAERLLRQAVEAAGGDFPEAQLLWCKSLGRMGRWTEALGCFTLIKRPEVLETSELIDMADAARSAGVLILSQVTLEAALKSGPHQQSVLRPLIAVKYELGEQQAALELCRELQRSAPDDHTAWTYEARIHRQRMQVPQAIRAYRRAMGRTPPEQELLQVRRELVPLLIDAGDVEGARAEIETLRAAGERAQALRLQNAYVLRLEGDSPAALAAVETVLAETPDSPQALMLRGVLWLDADQPRPAVRDLEQVVAAQPFNKEAHYKLAQALLRLDEDRQAQTHLDKSRHLTTISVQILDVSNRLAEEPNNRRLRKQLARLYDEIGQPENAARIRRSLR